MSKVSKEIGFQDISEWLDYKKVSANKREAQKDTIETLADAISEGTLVLKEDKSLEMTLKFPTEGEEPLTKLTFKPRLRTETVAKHLQGVKATDIDGRLLAYVAALTGNTKTLVGKLDTEDQSLAQAIAVFFV
jgi:hypothetical protein